MPSRRAVRFRRGPQNRRLIPMRVTHHNQRMAARRAHVRPEVTPEHKHTSRRAIGWAAQYDAHVKAWRRLTEAFSEGARGALSMWKAAAKEALPQKAVFPVMPEPDKRTVGRVALHKVEIAQANTPSLAGAQFQGA